MLVVLRMPDVDDDPTELARAALAALAARPGFVRGRVGRAADDPRSWVLVCEWRDAGSWRRALSQFDVRMAATPFLGLAADEPGAYEVLLAVEHGVASSGGSDRAADAATVARTGGAPVVGDPGTAG